MSSFPGIVGQRGRGEDLSSPSVALSLPPKCPSSGKATCRWQRERGQGMNHGGSGSSLNHGVSRVWDQDEGKQRKRRRVRVGWGRSGGQCPQSLVSKTRMSDIRVRGEGEPLLVSLDEERELTLALTSWRTCMTLTRAAEMRAGGQSLTGAGSRDRGRDGGRIARTGSYLQEFY